MGQNAVKSDVVLVCQYAVVFMNLAAEVARWVSAKHAGVYWNIVSDLNVVVIIVNVVLPLRVQEHFVILLLQVIFFQLFVANRIFDQRSY